MMVAGASPLPVTRNDARKQPRRGCRRRAERQGEDALRPRAAVGGVGAVGGRRPHGFAADAETCAARTHKELAAGCPA